MRQMFLSAVFALTAAAALAQGGGSPQKPQPQPVQWERTYSKDGVFSIEMPGRPVRKAEELTAKNGSAIHYVSYTLDKGNRAYMASTSDYDNQTKISLDGAIDGVLSAWKNPKNIRRREVTLFSYPGQTVDFDSESFHVAIHVFAKGRRLYQFGYVAESGVFSWESCNGFMDSFRFEK